jgi:dephospho-CoA kinase
VARAVDRGGLTREDAEARIAAQLPAAEKIRVATYVIDNDGPLGETEAQVDQLLAKLR